MKKLTLAIVALFMCIVLVSCGGNQPRKVIYDTPGEQISSDLKLNTVSSGVSLQAGIDKSKAYSDVKVAAEPSSTLFCNVVEIEDYMNDRLSRFQVNALFFNGSIYSSDATNFMTVMNNAEYGLTAEKVGKTFIIPEEDKTKASLYGKVSVSTAVGLPSGYEKVEGKKACLVVAYLPTYCIYNDGTQDYTKVFMMIPVYYSFTYVVEDQIEDENFFAILKYPVELVNGLLPSASSSNA